ncbi:hypothetical protein DSO57_1005554 [Entomophthora muscae]|uniref:Uncharacterized protein n=1 Tax=Entomophthora muscae TaxID=34485 RepID=A0ACC2TJH5_9FUNG|nr:hypothetical protein DSO57_1005554 [Entomophthora muscae]
MEYLARPVGWFVSSLSRTMPLQADFFKPMQGSWYISPAQHGFELLIVTGIFYLIFLFSIKHVCRPGSPEWKLLALYDNTQPMTLLEKAMSYSALTSWFLILVYKGLRNDLISMLQPCHVNLMVLIFILNFPKKYTLPHFVFNVFTHGIWGTLLAISAPDLRGYDMLLEVENFWFEHYLLLFAPFLLMFTDRYVLWPPSFAVGILSYSFNALYNVPFLSSIALLTGLNVNYTLSPPPGILESFGTYYRIVSIGFLCVISLILRFTFTELGRLLVIRSKDYYSSVMARLSKGARVNQ